jgi:hypothetical protein
MAWSFRVQVLLGALTVVIIAVLLLSHYLG